MKLAIMQPYLFPYIGYFQLFKAADRFVIYDDVNFIKGGWINRNNLLINKNKTLFTVPLEGASPFNSIKDTKINAKLYPAWKIKFLRSVEQSYKKAPFYNLVYPMISEVFENVDNQSISQLATRSIESVAKYLKLTTDIVSSSSMYENKELSGQDRVIDICLKEGARQYINVIGGVALYSKEDFSNHIIDLHFIQTLPLEYDQFGGQFVPSLSIIDVLMFNDAASVVTLLDKYELI